MEDIYDYRKTFIVPPVLGTYDDYGGIDLLEDLISFKMVKGENWSPRDEGHEGSQIFIDADVFDFLKTLEPEFTYGDMPKTLGEAWQRQREKIVEYIKVSINFNKDDRDYFIHRMKAREIFGYEPAIKNIDELFEVAVDQGKTLSELEPLIEAYGRSVVLLRAFSELRKKPATGMVYGPQHGGEQALIPFYRFVAKLAHDRRINDRDEGFHWDAMDKDFPLEDWKKACATGETLLGYRDWQAEQA